MEFGIKPTAKEDSKDRFLVTTEDYLHGLISLVNELVILQIAASRSPYSNSRNPQSRLAVNAVTLGNFQQPIQISIFVKDLFAGFSQAHILVASLINSAEKLIHLQLNLKNDSLRRRFDSLKYDMKKIEEGAISHHISLETHL